jgi:hypothetical protein
MVMSLVRIGSECRRSKEMRKAKPVVSLWPDTKGLGGVKGPRHARKQRAREPGDPLSALSEQGRVGKPKGIRR